MAAARNPPPKVVTIGTLDSAEILMRYNVQLALAGRTDLMGLASIAAEIARGRPADATLH